MLILRLYKNYILMIDPKRQAKLHDELLNEIDEQVNRILIIEAEANKNVRQPVSKWRKLINKVLCKNTKW